MIREALSGQWSVERFQKEYYWYFLDSVRADAQWLRTELELHNTPEA